jgi:diguanylate cyclase (GGDEF)-like protein/PAS domain S-box-containing protein
MNVFVLLNLSAVAIHAVYAVAVLRRNPRAAPNRILFLTGLLFAWWGLCYALAQGSDDPATYWRWYRAGAIAWTAAPALMLHLLLLLALADRGGRRTAWLGVVYIPAAVFLVRSLTGTVFAGRIERGPWGWVELPAEGSLWPAAFAAYFLGSLALGICAVALWRRRARHRLARRQASIVLAAGATTVAAIALVEVVLPFLGRPIPVFSAFLAVLWVGGVWFAISRAGLLQLSVSVAAGEILAAMEDGVLLLDPAGRIVHLNRAAARMFEHAEADLLGKGWSMLLAEQRVADEARLARFLLTGPLEHFETRGRRKSGSTLPLYLSATTARTRSGATLGSVLVLRNATNLRRAEERLHHLAHHDVLTGLPNRVLFRDRLENALHRARRCGEPLGVMVIDLDRFKAVNDGLGHEAGDALLRAVAERLAAGVRKSDTVARLGGDEFAAALPDLKRPEDVQVVADRFLRSLERPVDVGGRSVAVQASIGISLRPRHGDDADVLLRAADAAMYRAKATGRGGWAIWDPAWAEEKSGRLHTVEQLRKAVSRGELVLHYQPQRSTKDRTVVGVEALVRWAHPERGLLGPLEFLPLAAEAGLMRPISAWILATATTQLRAWQKAGLSPGRLAVNVGARELMQPQLLDQVRSALDASGLPPRRLELEITEDAATLDDPEARRTLAQLDELGVGLAIDDFGSGPTSLVFLARFPIRTLKLGASLVAGLPRDRERAAIVRTAVALARSLKRERVVAEGVETEEQLAFLRELGVDAVQGHLIERPMTADECAAAMRARP